MQFDVTNCHVIVIRFFFDSVKEIFLNLRAPILNVEHFYYTLTRARVLAHVCARVNVCGRLSFCVSRTLPTSMSVVYKFVC